MIRAGELRAAARYGLAIDDRLCIGRVIALVIAITWLPLVVLTLIAGTAFSGTVAIPCLSAGTSYFWWRETGISSWMLTREETGATLTMAGSWYLFVPVPLMRLLPLRALWKFAVWVWLLVRLSRLDLRIDPLHPDRCCGLLFLSAAQLAFLPLVAACGVQLGCMVAVMVRHQGVALSNFRLIGVAFVVLSVALILGPLGIFARRAWLAIEEAQDKFGTWSALAAEHMSVRLAEARREHMSSQLSTSEISSITDGASLFDRVLTTSAVPIDLRQILAVAATAMGSALFPLFALLPIAEIFERLAKVLL